jgi:hypothetical protein
MYKLKITINKYIFYKLTVNKGKKPFQQHQYTLEKKPNSDILFEYFYNCPIH